MYKVTVGKFSEVVKNDFTERYMVDDKNLKELICIKRDDYMIDINNGDAYPIIRREHNLIAKDQDIVLNREYALYVSECKDINKTKKLIK